MNKNELRIGNITNKGRIVSFYEHGVHVGMGKCYKFSELEPEILTEDWLKKLGFISEISSSYCNGFKWTKQINGHIEDEDEPNLINRDGTWFDGIGTRSFERTGEMAANVICRGNYICGAPATVHEVQNIFFALSYTEIQIK